MRHDLKILAGSLFALPFLYSGQVNATSGQELIAHLESCVVAMDQGDISAFDSFAVETEVTNETTLIRGWRSIEDPNLSVSLLRRAVGRGRIGMCDMSYPFSDNGETAQEIEAYLAELASDPRSQPDPNGMGRSFLACIGTQPVSIFVDTENLDKGLSSQIALVSRTRHKCD